MVTGEEVRAEAIDLLMTGKLDMTTMWLEFIARGGMGSIPDFDDFLAGLNPFDEISVQLLGLTLREIQEA
ncbi:hypothetical protein Pure05_38970 [Paenarthrobacter ureafaciens]|nr:hypothetical protein Pure01_38990 [Paenarthrobacter ureafaciens]GLU65668.1 hypothetical protein Pure02_39180 [Paenarthrobacter ureafaciens]GLU69981.1 hypothetical protein Pure03_39570 [Paenarthrobacter ureafaciens]GLU78457.1 hypothetical protein Pure05_38970 [Paenarthrobacter ureafaciens]